MEACEPRKRIRWHRWLLGLGVVLVLLLDQWMGVFHLLVGWIEIIRTNWLGLRLSPPHLALALVMALAAVFGLHLLANAWRKRLTPDSGRWRLRWSLGLVGMLLASATAAIAFAGVAHQVAWMKGEQWKIMSHFRDRSRPSAFDIAIQLEDHANHNKDGRYPDGLNEVNWTMGRLSGLFPSWYLLFRETLSATPEPWVYYGKGLTTKSPPGLMLLAAPRPQYGGRWVVLTPSQLEQVSEAEFESLVQQSLTVPRHD